MIFCLIIDNAIVLTHFTNTTEIADKAFIYKNILEGLKSNS